MVSLLDLPGRAVCIAGTVTELGGMGCGVPGFANGAFEI